MPDVLRDLDPGAALPMSAMTSSLSFGVHLTMHHPSAHWMTFGAPSPANALSFPASDSLERAGSTMNAMYLRLPRSDLTTIATPSLVRYKLFLDRGHPAAEHHPAPVAHLFVHRYALPASAQERTVGIGYHSTASADVPVHDAAASGTDDMVCRARRQESFERGAAVGAFPGRLRTAQVVDLSASALGDRLIPDVVETDVALHVRAVVRGRIG